MWRLRYWLSRLGIWLWLRYGGEKTHARGEKTHIAFRHTKCGSEVVQLAIFRPWCGPEFRCFRCNAVVPAKDVTFRILSAEEVEKIRAEAAREEGYTKQSTYEYFKSAALPHVVA